MVELTVVQQSLSGKVTTYTISVELAEDKGSCRLPAGSRRAALLKGAISSSFLSADKAAS